MIVNKIATGSVACSECGADPGQNCKPHMPTYACHSARLTAWHEFAKKVWAQMMQMKEAHDAFWFPTYSPLRSTPQYGLYQTIPGAFNKVLEDYYKTGKWS